MGLGTDLGGSIRSPSAYQGLWGLRPSTGRFPYHRMRNSCEGQEIIPVNGRPHDSVARIPRALRQDGGRFAALAGRSQVSAHPVARIRSARDRQRGTKTADRDHALGQRHSPTATDPPGAERRGGQTRSCGSRGLSLDDGPGPGVGYRAADLFSRCKRRHLPNNGHVPRTGSGHDIAVRPAAADSA
ncbi:hypothetical protein VTN77DRAFT_9136 [Rasamsonia byssochlamydoides]|uniref:uncharacterized protein n=1 Tax=Rasamsonia byssochlamydoides TaxID=89139 RepID=UPI00374478D1